MWYCSTVDGILLQDKPRGMTSHDLVDDVRRRLGRRDVGHAGTLDPLATGLLVLCVGKALKIVEYLEGHDKTYEVEMRLGQITDTDDADGKPLEERPLPADLRAAVAALTGTIRQKPPRYSAIKKEGRKLYEYARAGQEVETPERTVRVYEFAILDWAPPVLRARIRCSKGTYIRSLARDLGGHVTALRRMESGPFRVEDAGDEMLPMDVGLQHLPEVRLSGGDIERFEHGRDIAVPAPGPLVRVYGGPVFLGIGEKRAQGIHPRKVLVP